MQKKIYLMLSVFFTINPHIEAAPKTAEAPLVAEPVKTDEPGGSTEPPLAQQPVGVGSKTTTSKVRLNPLKKIEFEITMDVHMQLLSTYEIDYDRSRINIPGTFSDKTIEKATKYIKSTLYSSNANIRKWQIAKKVLEGIDKKIEESLSAGSSIEHLRSFRDATFREHNRALGIRKVFLADALKIAAELSVWKTVYDAYRSHFEAEHAEASERVLVFFNDQSMIPLCENLYKAKDSVDTGSLDNSIVDCRVFIDEIKGLLAPLISSPIKEASIGEYAQKEKFLEDVKTAFESPEEDMSSFFNLEDGAVLLSVLADCLAFYRTQRTNLEARVADRAARIASEQAAMEAQRAAAVARAERIASEQRLAVARAERIAAEKERAAIIEKSEKTTKVFKEECEKRAKVFKEELAKLFQEEKAINELALEVSAYAKCMATRDLYSLYNVALPEPTDVWQCENIYPGLEKSIAYELSFLGEKYSLATSMLAKRKPVHPWLSLDLYVKALQNFERNIPPHLSSDLGKSYAPSIKLALEIALKTINENKAYFSEISQQQIPLMLRHALVKGIINEHASALCVQGSALSPTAEQFSLKDGALCQTTFSSEWTDYLDNGFITPETMRNGLSKLKAWEENLRYPLNYEKFGKLLHAAWSEVGSPRQQQKCIYIGTADDHALTFIPTSEVIVDWFRNEIAHFSSQLIDVQNLPLSLKAIIQDDAFSSTLPVSTTQITQRTIQPSHQSPSLNSISIARDNVSTSDLPVRITETVQPSTQTITQGIGFYTVIAALGAMGYKIFSDMRSTQPDKAAPPSEVNKNKPLSKQEKEVLSRYLESNL